MTDALIALGAFYYGAAMLWLIREYKRHLMRWNPMLSPVAALFYPPLTLWIWWMHRGERQ